MENRPVQQKVKLKSVFQVSDEFPALFTGGAFDLAFPSASSPSPSIEEDHSFPHGVLFTALRDEVGVVDAVTGRLLLSIPGDAEDVAAIKKRPGREPGAPIELIIASKSKTVRHVALKRKVEEDMPVTTEEDAGPAQGSSADLLLGQRKKAAEATWLPVTLHAFKAHDASVTTLDFDPTGRYLATGSTDTTIKVWDMEGRFCTHNLKGHGGILQTVKFDDKDPFRLFSTSDDTTARVWDLKKKKCIAVLKAHSSSVRAIDLDASGTLLMTAGRDQMVHLWSAVDYKLKSSYPVFELIEAAGFVPQEDVVAMTGNAASDAALFWTAGGHGTLKLWSAKTGTEQWTEKRDARATFELVNAIYHKEAHCLVTASSESNLALYNVSRHPHCFALDKLLIGFNDEIIHMCAFGKEKEKLAVVTNTQQIRLFDMATWACEVIYGHEGNVLCLASSADKTRLASGGKDAIARLWGPRASQPDQMSLLAECRGHAGAVGAIALPYHSTDFMLTASQDCTVKCWDLTSIMESNEETTQCSTLYTFVAHDKDINSLSLSPNDKLFATASQDKTVKLWDTLSGQCQRTLRGHKRGVWCAQFSHVQKWLVTGSADRTIKLWDLNDGACIKTFEGHMSSVLSISFASEGTQLISTCSSAVVKVWNIRTQECITTLDGHDDKVWCQSNVMDGARFLTGGADSKIIAWEDVTQEHAEEQIKAEEERMVQKQTLENLCQVQNWREAIHLGLKLGFPRKIMDTITKMLAMDPQKGRTDLRQIVATLSKKQLATLLRYILQWNTAPRTAYIAQLLLHDVLRSHPPAILFSIDGINDVLDGLMVYTERHRDKWSNYLQSTYAMDLLAHEAQQLSIKAPVRLEEEEELMQGRVAL